MKKARRYAVAGAVIVALVVDTAGLFHGLQLAAMGTAYKAKILCSGIFVSKRDVQVDWALREVSADFFGLAGRKAVYREGQGCAVVHDQADGPATLLAGASARRLRNRPAQTDELQTGAGPPPAIDRSALAAALDWAFSETDANLPRRTRAVAVVYKRRLVAASAMRPGLPRTRRSSDGP
ncbi:MAG TPA: hypothetical protein VLS27_04760 [Gammaproteobacteria bacterium]|nr:hypothetical protein [Gammaproteobacteria bacterium]